MWLRSTRFRWRQSGTSMLALFGSSSGGCRQQESNGEAGEGRDGELRPGWNEQQQAQHHHPEHVPCHKPNQLLLDDCRLRQDSGGLCQDKPERPTTAANGDAQLLRGDCLNADEFLQLLVLQGQDKEDLSRWASTDFEQVTVLTASSTNYDEGKV